MVPVHAVSTGRDGQLDVPDNPRSAGWWRRGSRVGDPSGNTLLAAHIDSPRQRLGPFAELYDARPGGRLVLRSAGLRQDFRIRSVRLIRRESLTARPDLYSPSGTRQLVLITCAPPYDPTRGGYRNLVVLVARPSGPGDSHGHPMSRPNKKATPATTQESRTAGTPASIAAFTSPLRLS